MGNLLYSVAAVSATDVWAVGYSWDSITGQHALIEHWNGSSWQVVPSPNPGYSSDLFSVVAISATNVWAVGQYNDGTVNALIEQWNGTSWNVVPSPNPNPGTYNYLSSVAAVTATNIWAVGDSWDSTTNTYSTLIEHWNGSSWKIVSSLSPGANSSLNGLAAVTATNIWAVGDSWDSTTNTYSTLTEHWNGSSWKIVPSPNPGGNDVNVLSGAVVISANNVWAVGSYYNTNGNGGTLIVHWNGSSWQVVPSPN